MLKKILCLVVGLMILELSISTSRAGTITGKVNHHNFKYQKDCVVYLKKVEGNFKPGTTQMDQRNRTFIPQILPIMVGTTVEFLNSDTIRHNVNWNSPKDSGNLGTFPPGKSASHKFEKLDEKSLSPNLLANNSYDILCNLHAEMWAQIIVLQNPYFAVTDKEGNYKIENAPEGTFTICIWTPHNPRQVRRSEQVVTIGHNETVINFDLNRKS